MHFHEEDCAACAARPLCTRKRKGPRELTLPVQRHHEAMTAARGRQDTAEFWERYATRSGVEGVISQGVRTCGLRHSRYRGLAKTPLQHVATAAALNLKRAVDWRDAALAVVSVAVLAVSGGLSGFANSYYLLVTLFDPDSQAVEPDDLGQVSHRHGALLGRGRAGGFQSA